MSRLTEKFNKAYTSAQTMSTEERKLNLTVQKLILKKSILPLSCIGITAITGIIFNINTWIILGIELALIIFTYKHMKKQADKINDFKYYAGNILSIEDKDSHSVIILKQGKMPIKLKVKYGKDSFANLKKNQFIKIGYNKEVELASIIK